MEGSRVQSISPSLPTPSKLVTCLPVFSAVHRVDETVAGGKVAGDQRAVYKVHGRVVVHLQW